MNDKTIVFGSLSLRSSVTNPTTSTTNDVLGSVSVRASVTNPSTTTTNEVLKTASLPVAGFEHNGGTWEDPEDMSYVTIDEP